MPTTPSIQSDAPRITSQPSAASQRSRTALLQHLEGIRSSLSARVGELGDAVERLREQARVLQTSLSQDNMETRVPSTGTTRERPGTILPALRETQAGLSRAHRESVSLRAEHDRLMTTNRELRDTQIRLSEIGTGTPHRHLEPQRASAFVEGQAATPTSTQPVSIDRSWRRIPSPQEIRERNLASTSPVIDEMALANAAGPGPFESDPAVVPRRQFEFQMLLDTLEAEEAVGLTSTPALNPGQRRAAPGDVEVEMLGARRLVHGMYLDRRVQALGRTEDGWDAVGRRCAGGGHMTKNRMPVGDYLPLGKGYGKGRKPTNTTAVAHARQPEIVRSASPSPASAITGEKTFSPTPTVENTTSTLTSTALNLLLNESNLLPPAPRPTLRPRVTNPTPAPILATTNFANYEAAHLREANAMRAVWRAQATASANGTVDSALTTRGQRVAARLGEIPTMSNNPSSTAPLRRRQTPAPPATSTNPASTDESGFLSSYALDESRAYRALLVDVGQTRAPAPELTRLRDLAQEMVNSFGGNTASPPSAAGPGTATVDENVRATRRSQAGQVRALAEAMTRNDVSRVAVAGEEGEILEIELRIETDVNNAAGRTAAASISPRPSSWATDLRNPSAMANTTGPSTDAETLIQRIAAGDGADRLLGGGRMARIEALLRANSAQSGTSPPAIQPSTQTADRAGTAGDENGRLGRRERIDRARAAVLDLEAINFNLAAQPQHYGPPIGYLLGSTPTGYTSYGGLTSVASASRNAESTSALRLARPATQFQPLPEAAQPDTEPSTMDQLIDEIIDLQLSTTVPPPVGGNTGTTTTTTTVNEDMNTAIARARRDLDEAVDSRRRILRRLERVQGRAQEVEGLIPGYTAAELAASERMEVRDRGDGAERVARSAERRRERQRRREEGVVDLVEVLRVAESRDAASGETGEAGRMGSSEDVARAGASDVGITVQVLPGAVVVQIVEAGDASSDAESDGMTAVPEGVPEGGPEVLEGTGESVGPVARSRDDASAISPMVSSSTCGVSVGDTPLDAHKWEAPVVWKKRERRYISLCDLE